MSQFDARMHDVKYDFGFIAHVIPTMNALYAHAIKGTWSTLTSLGTQGCFVFASILQSKECIICMCEEDSCLPPGLNSARAHLLPCRALTGRPSQQHAETGRTESNKA